MEKKNVTPRNVNKDDYKDEVTSKFKKNLTKAFDTKTDTNTLLK